MPYIRSVAAFMSTTWRHRRPKSSSPTSRNGNSTTICFWTAMRSSCAGTEDACNAWAVDLADGSVIELDTRGGNVMPFSAHYECDGYFAGLLSNSPGNYELCHISKEDFYRSNYDGAFQ